MTTQTVTQISAAARGKWPVILQMLRIDIPENGWHGPCPKFGASQIQAATGHVVTLLARAKKPLQNVDWLTRLPVLADATGRKANSYINCHHGITEEHIDELLHDFFIFNGTEG